MNQKITLDNIVYVYEDVPVEDCRKMIEAIEYYTTYIQPIDVRTSVGKGASEYRYMWNIGRKELKGEGAITIQYQHNSEEEGKDAYNMRIEFNPAKLPDDYKPLFTYLQGVMYANIRVTSIDVALDVTLPKNAVWITPKTGRERNTYKGTFYFGDPGNNGYLKVYDKKKEREDKGKEIEEEHLTRIEFRWRGKQRIDKLNALQLDVKRFYDIRLIDYEEIGKAELLCMIKGVMDGWVQLKDFTRTNRKKIENALEHMRAIDFDALFEAHKTEIIHTIQRYALGYILQDKDEHKDKENQQATNNNIPHEQAV